MMSRALMIAVALGTLLSAVSAAADPFVGAKLAFVNMDDKVRDDPLNVAIDFGYSLDTWVADLSVIAEHSQSVDDGKARGGEDLELKANAVYLLWKTTRSMYVSLRVGAVQTEIVTDGDSDRHLGLLWGAGIGQVIGRTRLQIEYTSLTGDATFFGIGLEFDL